MKRSNVRIRNPPGVDQQIQTALVSQSSEAAALRLQKVLNDVFRQIEQFPESGRMQNPPREDLRLILVDKFRLIYLIDYEQDLITLVSFVYAGLPGDALD